ncbi:hypothetical protein BJV82DRAFT_713682 [Fennellomyces sp. T-0311]|nr:hypothetical protein BJV82DRAFT_713682 [Fennellomyces sp. T-0311]
MYIEYDENQRTVLNAAGRIRTSVQFWSPTLPFDAPMVPIFKPTWLVRVSNMQVVPGSSVKGHYWCLSYSWNQSGELIHRGGEKYDRIDSCGHQIITYDNSTTIDDSVSQRIRYVNFNDLIQQICIDFCITYIWYDQLCIDQNDHDSKMREIQQMHLIYKNARCTLALIPELRCESGKTRGGYANMGVIPESQWSKRMWTLEEAYMSRNILFVGRDVHIWLNEISEFNPQRKSDTFLEYFQNRLETKWKASTILSYARTRTTSKPHDRIFALANIFTDLKSGITFSYDQPLIDLTTQFYSVLARNDATILLFGAAIDSHPGNKAMIAKETEASLLPSWTGVTGAHVPIFKDPIIFDEATFHRSIAGKYLCINSKFIRVRIKPDSSVERSAAIHTSSKSGTYDGFYEMHPEINGRIVAYASGYLTFVATASESQDEYNKLTTRFGVKATHYLPLEIKRVDIGVNTIPFESWFKKDFSFANMLDKLDQPRKGTENAPNASSLQD